MKIEEYEDTVFKVGKNSKENWELLKENRNYMWFHLESFSSCYVICCDENSFLVILVCMGIIDAGMSIWGGIELFEYSCSDLENTNLFTFGLVTFILQTMVAGTSLVIVPLFTCFLAIFDK